MTIFLLILKVVGWTAATVLGLALLLLILILFVPVRFGLHGVLRKDRIQGLADARWLLGLVRVHAAAEGKETRAQLRILWFKRTLIPEKTEEEEWDRTEVREDVEEAQEAAAVEAEQSGPFEGAFDSPGPAAPKEDTKKKKKKHRERRSPLKKVQGMYHRIVGILRDIEQKGERVKRAASDERNRLAVSHIRREALYLLRHYMPKRSRVGLTYSAGSCDRTGLVYGLIAVMPVAYSQEWRVEPDFHSEEAYADGVIDIWGRIRLIHLLISFLRLFFDRNCRRMKAMIDKYF